MEQNLDHYSSAIMTINGKGLRMEGMRDFFGVKTSRKIGF